MGSIIHARLLPQVLDEIASDFPDRLYCIHPSSLDVRDGWRKITFGRMANAVNRVAWWIDQELREKGSGKPQVLAYIGTQDLRYAAFMLGCMKSGHTPFLLSTRNSQQTFHHLLEVSQCSILVDASEKHQLRQALDGIVADRSQKHVGRDITRWHMAPMWEIFNDTPSKPYPFDKSFYEMEDQPAILIHSSGTTGLPKPATISHGYLAVFDNMRTFPIPPGRQSAQLLLHFQGRLRLQHGPLFHFMGLISIVEGIFYETPFLLGPDRPLTADLLSQIMESGHPPEWALIGPHILKELVATDLGRRSLSRLKAVNYGGAPISKSVGETVGSLLRLQTMIGSTETGYTASLLCEDPSDWGYLEWNPAFGVRMDKIEEGLWELVIPRPGDGRHYHAIFHSYPNISEYRTGDMFSPHPAKPGLWQYEGRADDIIVLSNGEKFNPIDAETRVEAHDLVDRAAIFGQNRFQAVLLIQPRWDQLPADWTPEGLKRAISPAVESANDALPGHAKIVPTHIALASPERPFALSPKETLRRREVATTYKDVLDGIYGSAMEEPQPEIPTQTNIPSGNTLGEIEGWVQGVVSEILKLSTKFEADDDFVTLGIDSLQVAQLARVLQDTSRRLSPSHEGPPWSSTMIYEMQTVRRVAQAVHRQIQNTKSEPGKKPGDGDEVPWTRSEWLNRTIWHHARYLEQASFTIAITGSTGELGSYLLHGLLQDPSVTQIYCLNRSSDGLTRQMESFRNKGFSSLWMTETSRVQFLQARLHEEDLGLSRREYGTLRDTVDAVLHNAWPVNFNQPLSAFDSQITGVRRLLQLVDGSSRRAELHFVSSISTVGNWQGPEGSAIPETLHDASSTLPMGYAESKFVAESLCGIAAQRCKIPIAIHRVGQLGGPSSLAAGMWNPRDWFPALIRSSQRLGVLPDNLGSTSVDWVPIDTAAQIITQIVQSRCRDASSKSSRLLEVYHIVNPQPIEWHALAPLAALACQTRLVTYEEWVSRLERGYTEHVKTLEDIPALQLLDFFKGLLGGKNQGGVRVEVSNAQLHSSAMRTLRPVDGRLLTVWLKQWKERWMTDLDV